MKARALCCSAAVLLVACVVDAQTADRPCDTAVDDCRAPLLELIETEHVAIDVAFWFMEDARYTAALRRKIDQGVSVRVLVDTRANSTYPLNPIASRSSSRQLRECAGAWHPGSCIGK